MYACHTCEGYTEPVAGIRMKTLCGGRRSLMAEFRLEDGSELPVRENYLPNEERARE